MYHKIQPFKALVVHQFHQAFLIAEQKQVFQLIPDHFSGSKLETTVVNEAISITNNAYATYLKFSLTSVNLSLIMMQVDLIFLHLI